MVRDSSPVGQSRSPFDLVGLGILVVTAAAAACGGDDNSNATTPAPDGGDDGALSPDTGDATKPEWGLLRRPSNTTCFAPPRDTSSETVKLEWVFQNVRPTAPTELVKAPAGIPGVSLYVLEKAGRMLAIDV